MENRTAFGEMSKRQERTAVTVYGVIEVPADCPHLWQNWWIAARPLSEGDDRKQTFVQALGHGPNRLLLVESPRPLLDFNPAFKDK